MESFTKRNSIRNKTSDTVRAYIRGQRVFIRNVRGAVVLRMRNEGLGRLEARLAYY